MDPEFPFDDIAFLSTEPMTDAEFAEYVKFKDAEIPIEDVDFSSTPLDDLP